MFNGLSCVSQGFQGVYKIAQKLKLTVLINKNAIENLINDVLHDMIHV